MKLLSKALLIPVIAGAMWSCSESKINPADRYFNQGEYQLAVQSYTEDLKYKPSDAKMLYRRGRAFQEMGNTSEAKADFEAALDQDPNNFQVLLSLSSLHLDEKENEKALSYAFRAEEISGAPAMASLLKGRAFHRLGRTEEALKAYGNAIKIDPKFGQAYFNRGMLKIGLERKKQACEDFTLALALEYPGAQEMLEKYCK
jgi:tetratricopeptide (TPR) repeat protein